eukprot:7376632-Prymnesium_polylepis.1
MPHTEDSMHGPSTVSGRVCLYLCSGLCLFTHVRVPRSLALGISPDRTSDWSLLFSTHSCSAVDYGGGGGGGRKVSDAILGNIFIYLFISSSSRAARVYGCTRTLENGASPHVRLW